MTKDDFRKEMVFHLIMAIVWCIVIAVAVAYRSQITWVFGVIAVAYLAIDELVNALFWRRCAKENEKIPES